MAGRCVRSKDSHNFTAYELMGVGSVLYCTDCGEVRRFELPA